MCIFLGILPITKEGLKTTSFVLTCPSRAQETNLLTLEKPVQVQIARTVFLNDTHGDLREFICLSLYKYPPGVTQELESTKLMAKQALIFYDIISMPTFQSFQHDLIYFCSVDYLQPMWKGHLLYVVSKISCLIICFLHAESRETFVLLIELLRRRKEKQWPAGS